MKSCNENGPRGKKSRNRRIKVPISPIAKYLLALCSERKSAKTLDPSRGGMGSRLNIASHRLRSIIIRSTTLKISDADPRR